MSEKALLIAREEIMRVIQENRASLSYDEASAIADELLQIIDWESPALMHKDMEWITLFYLDKLVIA